MIEPHYLTKESQPLQNFLKFYIRIADAALFVIKRVPSASLMARRGGSSLALEPSGINPEIISSADYFTGYDKYLER